MLLVCLVLFLLIPRKREILAVKNIFAKHTAFVVWKQVFFFLVHLETVWSLPKKKFLRFGRKHSLLHFFCTCFGFCWCKLKKKKAFLCSFIVHVAVAVLFLGLQPKIVVEVLFFLLSRPTKQLFTTNLPFCCLARNVFILSTVCCTKFHLLKNKHFDYLSCQVCLVAQEYRSLFFFWDLQTPQICYSLITKKRMEKKHKVPFDATMD